MKATLNLGKKTLKAISNSPEYSSLLETEGKEVEYTVLPQPVLNKKLVQATIILENGEAWTVYLDQLIIKEDEIPKRTKGILSIPKKSLIALNTAGIYKDLILANGTEVEFEVLPQPAVCKDMVMATIILNNTPYGVNLKYIK